MRRISCLLGLLIAGTALGGPPAARQHYVVRMTNGFDGVEPVEIRIVREYRTTLTAYAVTPTVNNIPHPTDASRLAFDAGAIKGPVSVKWRSANGKENVPLDFVWDAKVAAGKVQGAFMGKSVRSHRKVAEVQMQGTLGGSVTTGPEPPGPAAALEPGACWPSWRGPFENGSAPSKGLELVDDLWRARLAWVSEDPLPGTYESDARFAIPRERQRISGGYAAPIVADGRVYQYFYTPSQTVFAEDVVTRHQLADGYGREKWSVNADDVVLCVDAQTGKTLWKTVFREKALNCPGGKGGILLTPCYRKGRVFAMGTACRLYCLDGRTGDPIWESDNGRRAEAFERMREECLSAKHLGMYNRDLGTVVCVADDVVVVNDLVTYQGGQRRFGNGIVGLDAETGRHLWALPGSAGWFGCPIPWRHKGREYVISTSETKAVCVEPKTGKVLWETREISHDGAPAVTEDMLVCNAADGNLAGFRLGASGAQRVWSLRGGQKATISSPAICDGYVYAHCSGGQKENLLCVELQTGKVVGSHPVMNTHGSTIVGNGRVIKTPDGKGILEGMFLFRADPKDFRPLGELWAVPWANSTTPVLVDGRLFFRSPDALLCYDLRASSAMTFASPAAAKPTPPRTAGRTGTPPAPVAPPKAASAIPDVPDVPDL